MDRIRDIRAEYTYLLQNMQAIEIDAKQMRSIIDDIWLDIKMGMFSTERTRELLSWVAGIESAAARIKSHMEIIDTEIRCLSAEEKIREEQMTLNMTPGDTK